MFNIQRYGPGSSLFVYRDDKGWNPNIHSEQDITRKQADQAVKLVGRTLGEMMVSKCAFPRHAIVLFSGPTPVASINVCFECGDILVWPRWDPAPDWDDRKYEMYGKLRKVYDRVFPKWEALFGKELGLTLDWKAIKEETD